MGHTHRGIGIRSQSQNFFVLRTLTVDVRESLKNSTH